MRAPAACFCGVGTWGSLPGGFGAEAMTARLENTSKGVALTCGTGVCIKNKCWARGGGIPMQPDWKLSAYAFAQRIEPCAQLSRHGERKQARQRAANGRLPSVLFFAFCGGA